MEIDAGSQQLLVGDKRVAFLLVGDDRQPWFQAKPLAELLGYIDTDQAVRNNVRDVHRQSLRRLAEVFGDAKVICGDPVSQTGLRPQPQTVFVDEPGLYSLLMRSTRREAERFQEWVTAVVLPTIRRTGSYAPRRPDVPSGPIESLQMQQACRGFLDCYKTMLELGMATGPDRVFFADLARNAAMPLSTLPAIAAPAEPAAEVNARRMALPLSDICREVTGRACTKTELMTLGRLVARHYRERHDGADPPEVERCIDGTTRMVKAYSPRDDPWIRDVVAGVLSSMTRD